MKSSTSPLPEGRVMKVGKAGREVTREQMRAGNVASHFFDSGSFSLWTAAEEYAKRHNCSRWKFYDSKRHWRYVEDYAAFVKKYSLAIDLYANVDVIPNAELTWRNQQYLEQKHGLCPVPVVHYTCDLKWLQHYMDLGYELIAL